MSLRIATKAAQTLISEAGQRIAVDGVWGPRSEKAYTASPEAVQNAADLAVKQMGYSLEAIRNPVSSGSLVSPEDMSAIISRVASETGVGADVLRTFLDLEAARRTVRGVRYYVSDAVNSGGYRGLFQFDRRGYAWSSASKKGYLPKFDANWKDPYYSTLAAAYYVLYNSDILRSKGFKGRITGSIAYLMHNQGAAGAYRIMSGKGRLAGNQSGKAVITAKRAVSEFQAYA